MNQFITIAVMVMWSIIAIAMTAYLIKFEEKKQSNIISLDELPCTSDSGTQVEDGPVLKFWVEYETKQSATESGNIKQYPCKVGRLKNQDIIIKEEIVATNDTRTISREHLKIYYEKSTGFYRVQRVAKNDRKPEKMMASVIIGEVEKNIVDSCIYFEKKAKITLSNQRGIYLKLEKIEEINTTSLD